MLLFEVNVSPYVKSACSSLVHVLLLTAACLHQKDFDVAYLKSNQRL